MTRYVWTFPPLRDVTRRSAVPSPRLELGKEKWKTLRSSSTTRFGRPRPTPRGVTLWSAPHARLGNSAACHRLRRAHVADGANQRSGTDRMPNRPLPAQVLDVHVRRALLVPAFDLHRHVSGSRARPLLECLLNKSHAATPSGDLLVLFSRSNRKFKAFNRLAEGGRPVGDDDRESLWSGGAAQQQQQQMRLVGLGLIDLHPLLPSLLPPPPAPHNAALPAPPAASSALVRCSSVRLVLLLVSALPELHNGGAEVANMRSDPATLYSFRPG
ncbi:hypothetical protein Taro_010571 [Colocasia esculenta]|uniref:Uncharacterized protein n=1 Tax=Colocasia esculenta TaxID=4460 RepID=A0A843U9X0_COLES|nr:hypothetical protein [Colocasia esculenta]